MVTYHRFAGIFLAAAIGLGLGSAAHAARVDLNVFYNEDNVDTSFLDLWVDVTSNGSGFDFTFYNDSTQDATINYLFFEEGLSQVLDGSSGSLVNSPGTFFVLNNFLPILGPAGGNTIGWGLFHSVANAPGIPFGIDAGVGEYVTVSFDAINGATLDDVLDLLGTDGRIAANVAGIQSGDVESFFFGGGHHSTSSVSVVTGATVVPVPAAFWLGLSMLGGMGLVRRLRRDAIA